MKTLSRREFLIIVGASLSSDFLFPKLGFGQVPDITQGNYKILPEEEKWFAASKLFHKELTLDGKFATNEIITGLFDNLSMRTYSFYNQKLSPLETTRLIHESSYPLEDSVINEEFLFFQITRESQRTPNKVSRVGAGGLLQILPTTWSDYNSSKFYENVFIPGKNISTATKFINWLEKNCKDEEKGHPDWKYLGTPDKQATILAAYHCGLSRLKSVNWHIISTPFATRVYVRDIMENLLKV